MSEIIRIGEKRYKFFSITDGDRFYPGDINCISLDRGKAIIIRLKEGASAKSYTFETGGVISGYPGGYWILRELTEPETNEFGEVSP